MVRDLRRIKAGPDRNSPRYLGVHMKAHERTYVAKLIVFPNPRSAGAPFVFSVDRSLWLMRCLARLSACNSLPFRAAFEVVLDPSPSCLIQHRRRGDDHRPLYSENVPFCLASMAVLSSSLQPPSYLFIRPPPFLAICPCTCRPACLCASLRERCLWFPPTALVCSYASSFQWRLCFTFCLHPTPHRSARHRVSTTEYENRHQSSIPATP